MKRWLLGERGFRRPLEEWIVVAMVAAGLVLYLGPEWAQMLTSYTMAGALALLALALGVALVWYLFEGMWES